MGDEFAPGVRVKYKEVIGVVQFVDTEYLTICIYYQAGDISTTCVVVYNYDWNQVELLKSNR